MDYEKKYNEVLEKAKGLVDFCSNNELKTLEYVFPELKESEDCEIMNAIKEAVITLSDSPLKNKCLAWLEKQGEQKPTDKVEPKFKVRDWVILTAGKLSTTLQIISVSTDKKLYWFNDGRYLPIVDEECLRLWSIQDAKDGDVLSYRDGQWIFIYKGKINDNSFYYHALYSTVQGLTIANTGFTLLNDAITPATKEQRDTLMKAMADAGYTFDFEKKELKKIEQKPADIPEDFEKLVEHLLSLSDGEGHGSPAKVKEVSAELLRLANQQKPAEWSEDDEVLLKLSLENLTEVKNRFGEDYGRVGGCIDWLKSLKERIQPKQEWSEEDRKIIIELIGIFESAVDGGHVTFPYRLLKDYIRVLKSCLSQNTWKPSDEQIKVLNEVLNFAANHENPHWNDYMFGTLNNLIKQLKKLREE